MFESLSKPAKLIFNFLEQERQRVKTIGSEILLLALTEVECESKYILESYDVTNQKVKEEIEKLILIRKVGSEFTEKFLEIMRVAYNLKNLEDDEELYDDHILYAILHVEDSVAIDILKRLNVDLEELINEVIETYDFTSMEEENTYLINLSKEVKKGKVNPFIGREELIDKVIRILSKRQKNNVMLIGSAGVGKSALVEGVARKFLEINPKVTIYRLDLGVIIAGTRYRGDLEERLLKVFERIKNPNAIVFIDEIHNIIGSGSSEGTLDIANILKPILSSNEIKCIGATTLEEYHRYIAKDKALARRFQNVFIEEASEDEAFLILDGICHLYEDFHKVKYPKEILRYIVKSSDFLVNRKLPDKAIDILDEAALNARLAKRRKVEKKDVDKIVFENLGINTYNLESISNLNLNYPQLKKYYQIFFMNLKIKPTILNIQTTIENLDLILQDLKQIFNIENEQILTLDFTSFANHYTSTLIGSPAGYVGYNDGGVLTEHVNKFPIAIIIIKNYEKGGEAVKMQINTILETGKIIDAKGRLISFQNSIFIFLAEELQSYKIGFFKANDEKVKEKIVKWIDEVLYETPKNNYYLNLTKEITDRLKDFKYYIEIDCENMGYEQYKKILNILTDLDNFEKEKKYLIKCNLNDIEINKIK